MVFGPVKLFVRLSIRLRLYLLIDSVTESALLTSLTGASVEVTLRDTVSAVPLSELLPIAY